MKKILLCTDGSLYARVSYEYAAWLAKRVNVTIEVLYVSDRREEKAVRTNDYSGTIGIDAYQNLLDRLVVLEREKAKINHQRAEIILAEAQKFFSDRQVEDVKLTHKTGFLVDLFHQLEMDKDLVVLGKRGETANFATEHLGSNLERIIRSSHKPCLVTPREFRPIRQLLLAYDGGKSCQKAVEYLTNSSAFRDLELHLVTVTSGNEKRNLNQINTAAERLKLGGFEPICQLLHGETEAELKKYIEVMQIDFLVMGAYGHSRIRRLIIGSTTAQMLRCSHIPVLLFR